MTATAQPVVWTDPARHDAFQRWIGPIAPLHGIDIGSLALASADMGPPRHLRVIAGVREAAWASAGAGASEGAGAGAGANAGAGAGAGSLIVMDAPPPLHDARRFVQVAALAQAAGLHVPRVLHADVAQGFLLLTDVGSQTYLDALQTATPQAADTLMRDALAALLQFQQSVPAAALPPFDEALLAGELALFPRWCVQREFGITWAAPQQAAWDRSCRLLIDSALAQPVVAVHAGWMPRNLRVATPNPGILDFQDAVAGPITYDLASLLRDASTSWDEAQELDWAVRWWQSARRASLPVDADFGEFWRALEWMGLQRHLKMMGLACRLKHRDGQPREAAGLPHLFGSVNRVCLRYGPLKPLLRLLEPFSGQALAAGYTF